MMKHRVTRSALLMIMTLVMTGLFFQAEGSARSQHAPANTYFIDILYLKEGKTVADAQAYFKKIEPTVAKHGLKRV